MIYLCVVKLPVLMAAHVSTRLNICFAFAWVVPHDNRIPGKPLSKSNGICHKGDGVDKKTLASVTQMRAFLSLSSLSFNRDLVESSPRGCVIHAGRLSIDGLPGGVVPWGDGGRAAD